MRLSLDILQEMREQAEVIMATYNQKATQYFNKRVQLRRFKLGDWVLQKVTLATHHHAERKLAPTWEGPYRVIGCYQMGA